MCLSPHRGEMASKCLLWSDARSGGKRKKRKEKKTKQQNAGGLRGRGGREVRRREGGRERGWMEDSGVQPKMRSARGPAVCQCECACNNGRLRRRGCKVVFLCVCVCVRGSVPAVHKGVGNRAAGSARSLLRSPLPVPGVPRGSAGRCRGDAPRRAMPPSLGRGERAAPGKAVGTRRRGDSRRLAVRQRSSCLSS